MNKIICTTTINPPTPALRKYAEMEGWHLVVAGDKKTPEQDYASLKCTYLSPEAQEKMDKELSDLIGWNCIQRRNFAFLHACKMLNADIVATVDDDNEPMKGWGEYVWLCDRFVNLYSCKTDAFDPLFCTNNSHLWHRGFPLQMVSERFVSLNIGKRQFRCDIQANLWNGDPDIDAICRMIYRPDCDFDGRFPFASNKVSPFNSQNTFLSSKVMPHYFMFPFIGRMDDIWASYHVQAQGFRVVYGAPTVIQKRNEHDLTRDMIGEQLGYESNHRLVREIQVDPLSVLRRLPTRSLMAFTRYQSLYGITTPSINLDTKSQTA